MADPVKPPAPAPFKFDEQAFTKHLAAVKEDQLKYAGKHNHNPFTWIKANVYPIEEAFIKGDRTEELYKKALAVKSVPPVVNSNKIVPAEGKIQSEPVNEIPQPKGLKL